MMRRDDADFPAIHLSRFSRLNARAFMSWRKPAERWIACSMFLLVTACAPSTSNSAKQAPQAVVSISPGDRLRVTHNGECCTSPSIGFEQSLSADSLVLQAGEGTPRLAIARSNITRIERWNVGRTHMAVGGLLGFLGGAAAGGLIGFQSTCGHCDGDWRGLGAFFGVVIGGITGGAVGLRVGAIRHGFWETVP